MHLHRRGSVLSSRQTSLEGTGRGSGQRWPRDGGGDAVQRHGRPAQGRRPVKRYAGQPLQSGLVGLLSVAVPELMGRSAERHLDWRRRARLLWRIATSAADGVARHYSGVAGEGQSPHPEVGRTSDEVRTQRRSEPSGELPSLLSFV